MATLKTNLIEPEGATTTLTIGESGGNVVIGADSINNNTAKDAGGNTLWVSNGSGTLSSVNGGFGGSDELVSTATPDDVATVTFTLGTHKSYRFEFMEIKPVASGETPLMFQCSIDGTTFGPDLTTTVIRVYNNEADNNTMLDFNAGRAQQSATTFQRFDGGIGPGTAIGCGAGYLHLYNPSSTTHYKNFTMTSSARQNFEAFYTFELRNTGYWATTSALTHMRFQVQSGNIHSGTIKMYGIK